METITESLLRSLDPPHPKYNNGDTSSFAHKSASERWPIIITQVVDDLYRAVQNLDPSETPKIDEGKRIIESISKLKYDETHDRALEALQEDGRADIAQYNDELETLKHPTWFNVPWLFSECYLYRRIYLHMSRSQHWKSYDYFFRSKDSSFKSSGKAVEELAVRYKNLVQDLEGHSYDKMADQAKKLLFEEMSQISLWGNATDLSLLTNLSYEDMQKLQGAEAIKASQKNVLANDIDAVWNGVMKDLRHGRVDIVLDNAGFELFADLVFATYLLETQHCETIVLHPKDFAWFVSDVTPRDVAHLFACMSDEDYFTDVRNREALQFMTERWMEHYSEGRIIIRPNAFWTTAHPYTRLPTLAPTLLATLQESDLVIFKGDLNFRKLVGDAAWPTTTPFSTAIGDLAGKDVRVLAFRTCKADVCVGLPRGRAEQLDAEHGALTWRTNGKFAVVSFHDGKLRRDS